jgi:hypothetical protein
VKADRTFICPACGGHHFGRDTAQRKGKVIVLRTVRCHDEHKRGCKWRGPWPAPGDAGQARKERHDMETNHHCGRCACCGGDIPCGETHIRRWVASGECPGHVNLDGTCAALLSCVKRKKIKRGVCHN